MKIRSLWRSLQDINLLELEAVTHTVIDSERSALTRVYLVALYIDSTAAIRCVSKCLPSSSKLNQACHLLSSTLVLVDILFIPHWEPSQINFTDEQSRFSPRRTFRPTRQRANSQGSQVS